MSHEKRLQHLGALAGIEPCYWDISGVRHDTSPETARHLLKALGFPAGSPEEIEESITRLDEREWHRMLPPVSVITHGNETDLPINLASEQISSSIHWKIELEGGAVQYGVIERTTLRLMASRNIDGHNIDRLALPLPTLPLGYHELQLEHRSRTERMPLIVAPLHCYLPPAISAGDKVWGIAAQLYSVRSKSNWGIGDFSDLAALSEQGASIGADTVGFNPLHALSPSAPENLSPYSPSSRLFRNPLYLDVTAIEGYTDDLLKPCARDLAAARSSALVDYAAVSRLKFDVLTHLYAAFLERQRAGVTTASAAQFRAFQSRGGATLQQFALFQALSEHFSTNNWKEWPSSFSNPISEDAARFTVDHTDRIAFFQYLQWQCDLQLGAAAERTAASGMAIGLYGDLAVSIDPAGADHWSRQSLFADGARLGAPPDPFNALGQEWGIVPMNPWAMRESAYADFIALLRANMRHAGALRVDHIMGLQHAFWVPLGMPPAAGAYVTYPLSDLLGILALESVRNKCLIVGEALGTVPEGFRPRIAEAHILSYRVLYFEAEHGRQKAPSEYPPLAASCVSTHDLATLVGFWNATDIDARRELGLYPTPELGAQARHEREHDKWILLRALSDEGLLPPGLDTDRLADIAMTPTLASAVHAYLARSSACLFMVQLDDLAREEKQVNLPGTSTEYPNWRRRLSRTLDEIFNDANVIEMAGRISRERAGDP